MLVSDFGRHGYYLNASFGTENEVLCDVHIFEIRVFLEVRSFALPTISNISVFKMMHCLPRQRQHILLKFRSMKKLARR